MPAMRIYYFHYMAFHHRDQFAKSVIEDYAVDILRFFYPEADQLFDFTKEIEFLESEQIDLDRDPLTMKDAVRIDKVLKVHLLSGELAWIVISIEVQGYREVAFPERVFRYFYNLLNKYGRRVTMLTIYTDATKDYAPDSFNYSLLGTKLSFNFKTYKVFNQKEGDLAQHPNPVALLFLAILIGIKNGGKHDKSMLLEKAIQLAESVYQRDIDEKMKVKLLKTIQLYFNFENPEIQRKFGDTIDSITNKMKPMGIFEFDKFLAVEAAKERTQRVTRRETRKKTIQEKDTAFVKSLLQKTNHSLNKIANIAGVSLDFVKSVKAQIGTRS